MQSEEEKDSEAAYELCTQAEIELDKLTGLTGTPISIEPVREDPTVEPDDPEMETEEPIVGRSSRHVYKVRQGDKFRILVELRKAPNVGGAGIEVSFRDGNFDPVLESVFVRYIPGGSLVLDTGLITADTDLGDILVAGRMAIATTIPPYYRLRRENRRVRVCIIKVVP